MKKHNYIVGGVVVLVVLLLIFVSGSPIHSVNSKQFEAMINQGNGFVVQTHTPYEGEINGTQLLASVWEHMNAYASKLPQNKDMPLLVYCRSGHMSGVATKELSKMGYTHIYELDGGMIAWQQSGRGIIYR
jgi:rhodanese-related sulfurtransferase